ncbi:hypothetical protein [Nostoc sp. 'Lobaria pulmonaria (5183) cyanobiont']|uniref:hypothetical protein n=1 Tax=Nostoc sp. 'Lobaria pulmonaria (5183) cyanobiont' TaxID=1618022 RepID=UPI000CF32730|nr:hypothetical protein [Nostoc sp. 'Lobaria pulmonaria (5183) cyanobiont']
MNAVGKSDVIEVPTNSVPTVGKFGEAGLDLIIEALQNSEVDVQKAAYWLLQESTEPSKFRIILYKLRII